MAQQNKVNQDKARALQRRLKVMAAWTGFFTALAAMLGALAQFVQALEKLLQ